MSELRAGGLLVQKVLVADTMTELIAPSATAGIERIFACNKSASTVKVDFFHREGPGVPSNDNLIIAGMSVASDTYATTPTELRIYVSFHGKLYAKASGEVTLSLYGTLERTGVAL